MLTVIIFTKVIYSIYFANINIFKHKNNISNEYKIILLNMIESCIFYPEYYTNQHTKTYSLFKFINQAYSIYYFYFYIII